MNHKLVAHKKTVIFRFSNELYERSNENKISALTWRIDEESGKVATSRVTQPLQTSLAQISNFMYSDSQEVQCFGWVLSVEISSGYDISLFSVLPFSSSKHERVICCTVHLGREDTLYEVNRIQTNSHHLRHTSDSIRILNIVFLQVVYL